MPVPPRRVLPDAPTSDVATASPAVPRRAWLLRGVRARPGPRIAADTASALRASWAAGCPRAVQLRIRGQCSGLPLRAAPDEAWVRQALRVDAPRVAGSPGSRHAARDDLLRDMQRQLTPWTVIGPGVATLTKMSPRTIYSWESGRSFPTLEIFSVLASAYGLENYRDLLAKN